MPSPIVAIVGRPNVGKSTLFNRLTGGRVAIVDNMPGVTRDRLYRQAEWLGRTFTIVDTGGLDVEASRAGLGEMVWRQSETAVEEADVVLFVVDAREGLTPGDLEVAGLLRRSGKPVLVVANKVEHYEDPSLLYDFFNLGLGDPIPVSAAHGLNTGDLLDRVMAVLPEEEETAQPVEDVKVAVIGRPNVGKSSLVNRLLGEERVIVSSQPGTTRDSVDTKLSFEGRSFVLIDTAGIRRKARVNDSTEHYSVLRALKAIHRADVAAVILDSIEGVTDQDKRIAGIAHEEGKAAVLVINKWDLVEKDNHTMSKREEDLRSALGFLSYAPSVYISALSGQRVKRVLELAGLVADEASKRITTGQLNALLAEAQRLNPPPTDKGKRLKIFFATQVAVRPPVIVLFVNDPELLHFSYLRYLENRIRESFSFTGTPVRLLARRSSSKER